MFPIDTYRDSFLRFLAEGMTYEEAMQQFDEKAFALAAMQEIDQGHGTRANSLLELLAKAGYERRNGVHGVDYQQALDLWSAGWTSESHEPAGDGFWGQSQVMSWYWRRPSRRPGKPGRRFLSTNQAWRALQREDLPRK